MGAIGPYEIGFPLRPRPSSEKDAKVLAISFSKNRFQSLFLAANRGALYIFGITQNLDPLYDVLVEPLGYDALLLEYHGIEYPDLPEAPEKAISACRAVKGNSKAPHWSESPPPAEGWRFTILFQLSELKPVNSTNNILSSQGNSLLGRSTLVIY